MFTESRALALPHTRREKCIVARSAAANSPPFYRNHPRFSRPNSRLISLDPLELSKFSSLTDTNAIPLSPPPLPRGMLPSDPRSVCALNQFRIVSHELYSRDDIVERYWLLSLSVSLLRARTVRDWRFEEFRKRFRSIRYARHAAYWFIFIKR